MARDKKDEYTYILQQQTSYACPYKEENISIKCIMPNYHLENNIKAYSHDRRSR